jgi:septal ring factor EnvC (AmiA/AmiB activator)
MVVIMEESVDYSEIIQENLTIRERGNLSAQEYLRVVETFKKVLDYKEKFRNSLEAKLNAISKKVNDNVENLETLLRNIDIYDQNIDKISSNVGNLYSEESTIKTQYEELLNGSLMEGAEPAEKNQEDQEGSRELLIQRRRSYLDNLDKSFKRLDNELLSIEKLRTELTNARGEILVKKDGAKKKVRLLEEAGKKLLEEVKRIEAELESSIKEEGLLIKEFKVLVGKVEFSLEISDEMDHILFTHLTAEESRSLPQKNLVPVKE